jgi:Reverse transcriptase (RNA-dependent DNA polymerase)
LVSSHSLWVENAPATFQQFVDITVAGLAWKVCLVYLDDIIVYSKSHEEHSVHLDAVIHRLYRAGLPLNLKKCHLFRNEVSYLGHVLGPGTLAVAEKNVLLNKLGRGEGRDFINYRLNATRSRERDKEVAGSDGRKGE